MSLGAAREPDVLELWLRRTLAARFDRVLDEDVPEDLWALCKDGEG